MYPSTSNSQHSNQTRQCQAAHDFFNELKNSHAQQLSRVTSESQQLKQYLQQPHVSDAVRQQGKALINDLKRLNSQLKSIGQFVDSDLNTANQALKACQRHPEKLPSTCIELSEMMNRAKSGEVSVSSGATEAGLAIALQHLNEIMNAANRLTK